jgi:hypothetical protein
VSRPVTGRESRRMKWGSGRPEPSVGRSGFCSGYSDVARNDQGVWIVLSS